MEINKIPDKFLEHMKNLLGEKEFESFYNYLLKNEVKRSVTVNRNAEASFILNNIVGSEKIKLAEFGFYISSDFRLGESLLNHAGVIYGQDSSAMIPVELMNIEQGDIVLDLCAAPGGKSIQILNKLNETGLLISNEIEASRAKILFENITRMGYRNSVITNSTVEDFKKSKIVFDKILVDAPCSGEGLIAKSKSVVDWKPEYIESNAKRQLELLEKIKGNLKEGGVLVYSTCTFNLSENENVVYEFLKSNHNFKLVAPPNVFLNQLDCGIEIDKTISTTNCLRCYPHKNNGSGQFVAILKKISGENGSIKNNQIKSNVHPKDADIIMRFLADNLSQENSLRSRLYKVGNTYYILATGQDLAPAKILCNGCVLGEFNGKILKPNHSFFKQYGLFFKNKVELDEEDALKYVQGNQLEISNTINGYGVFLYKGFVLGGFKASSGKANNLYPKYLRN